MNIENIISEKKIFLIFRVNILYNFFFYYLRKKMNSLFFCEIRIY